MIFIQVSFQFHGFSYHSYLFFVTVVENYGLLNDGGNLRGFTPLCHVKPQEIRPH